MAFQHDDLSNLLPGESPCPTRPTRCLYRLAVKINREKAA
jgi:hypothetical protein